jgi:hypothetical protein
MPEESEITKTDSTQPGNRSPKKKKSFLKKILKFFLYTFFFFVLLIISILLLLQTSFFKNKLLSYGLDEINKSFVNKESHLSIESIEGNFFSGIKLNNISLKVKNDTLLKANSLELSYSLLPLLDKKVSVKSVTLDKPQINFTKIRDKNDSLAWNFAYLLQSEKPADTTKKEFDWDININNLNIINCDFRLLADKKSDLPIRQIKMNNTGHLNTDYLDITKLNLDLSGRYNGKEIFANINNLSLSTNSDFNLSKFTLSAGLEKDNTVHLTNFSLITNKSNLSIPKIEANNFDLFNFDYEKLGLCEIDGHISADRFDFSDLNYFLPDLDFIKGKFYLDLICKGKYSDINITKLSAKTNNSFIDISGNVRNLNIPKNLEIDASAKNCIFDPNDSKINFPGLAIPDYSHLGIVKGSFLFRGTVNRFYTEYVVNSNIGFVDGNTFLDITNEIEYRSDNSFKGFNIGRILKNKDLESNISGSISAKGSGTDYRRLISDINYDISNSNIFGQSIQKSSGTVKANKGNYNLNIKYIGDNVNTMFSGSVNIGNINNISYNIKGSASNLNLAGFTKQQSDKSNLNFTFDLNGKGTDIETINSAFTFNISPSQYQSYIIPETPLLLNISSRGSEKSINITSNILDFNAEGAFSYKTLPKIITDNLNQITESMKKQFGLDTNLVLTENSSIENNYGPVDLIYSMKIKNFVPLNVTLKDEILKLKANIKGTIKNNNNSFSFSADGDLNDVSLSDTISTMKKALLKVEFKNDHNKADLKNLFAYVDIKTNKVKYGNLKIDTLDFDISLRDNKNNFYIKSKLDTNIRILTSGEIAFNFKETNFKFDTLSLNFRDFKLRNSEPLILAYKITDTSNFLEFRKFEISEDKQKIDVNGYYSLNSNSMVSLTASNINLSDLSKLSLVNVFDKDLIKGNIKNFKIKYEGTFQNPDLLVEAYTDNIKLDTNSIGYIYAIVKYKENELKPDIVLIDPFTNGKLLINGRIPFDNPLISDSLDLDILNKEVFLDIKADSVQITLLEQYIPVISDIHGILKGNLSIRGKGNAPVFSGNMNLRNGSLHMPLNGVNYNFNFDVSTDNQKVIVNNSKLYFSDETDKFITFDGYLDFTDLKLKDFAFNMLGDIKVLDDKTSKNILGIYGNLYAGSGNPILTMTGNSNLILLSGNLQLKKGKILMSANQNRAFNLYDDNFIYKVDFDSNSFSGDSLKMLYAFYNDTLSKKNKYELNPFDKSLTVKDTLTKSSSGTGLKFIYDLSVTTLNSVYANFIIDDQTKQEFIGDVTTSLFIDNKNNDALEIRGRVDLLDNCYYKFYKVFNAKGFIAFNGNPTNPELHITAEYNSKSQIPNSPGSTRDVTIRLDVSGDAAMPKLIWSVTSDGSSIGGGDQTDQAISYIVFGKFKDELSASQQNNLFSNVGANVGANILSGYVSTFLQNYLPFIVNTDINYIDNSGGNLSRGADIRFTAAFGDATVRFGGQMLYDISNTNFIIEYPLNKLLKIKFLSNNLIFQFERLVDPLSQSTSQINTANRVGAIILYKINF